MLGKTDACTDEKPKDKRKKESDITLRESDGVKTIWAGKCVLVLCTSVWCK